MFDSYTTETGEVFNRGDIVTCYFAGVHKVVCFFEDDILIVDNMYERTVLVVVAPLGEWENGSKYRICDSKYLKHCKGDHENKA